MQGVVSELAINEKSNKVTLCAVSNPKITTFRPWFLNIFLGRLKNIKNKPNRNEVKTNWLMTLSDFDIELLKSKSCEIIKLGDEIEFTVEDNNNNDFKDGFVALYKLFNKAMKSDVLKSTIKELLTNKDGKPSKDYKKIIETQKML